MSKIVSWRFFPALRITQEKVSLLSKNLFYRLLKMNGLDLLRSPMTPAWYINQFLLILQMPQELKVNGALHEIKDGLSLDINLLEGKTIVVLLFRCK